MADISFSGKLVVDLGTGESFRDVPYFLFFFGILICIAFGFLRQLSTFQIVGLTLEYLFAVAAAVLLFGEFIGVDLGTPGERSVQHFLSTAPFVLFLVGNPIVAGYCLYRHMCIR